MAKVILYLLYIFPSLFDFINSSFSVYCNSKGACSRSDNILLEIGWISKTPLKNFNQAFDVILNRTVVSINPFDGANSFNYIKGSSNYTCADGVNECFNSCCSKGSCSDPSNVCTVALKSSDAIIYANCIAFCVLAIFYWVIFGIIGVKYSKKRAKVELKATLNDLATNNPPDSVNKPSILENFDDFYNSHTNRVNRNIENNPNNQVIQGVSKRNVEMGENPIMDLIIAEEAEEKKKSVDSSNKNNKIFVIQKEGNVEGEAHNNSEFHEHPL